MAESGEQPDAFFYRHRGGKDGDDELGDLLSTYRAVGGSHPYWSEGNPESLVIDEVEEIWSAIDERDDWQPLYDKVERLRRMGEAHGVAPAPAAHSA